MSVPFARPSVGDLITRIQNDLRGRLEVVGPLLRRAMVDVLGAAFAGLVHEVYGYLATLALQLFAATAEREALLRMASLYGIVPLPAQYAVGMVNITGREGAAVLSGAVLRIDAVTAYTVMTGATIVGGVGTIAVKATIAGAAANLAAGTAISFEGPIDGITPTAVVAAGGITGGDDGDDGDAGTERIRARLKLRLQEPPQGGADQDYIAWALAVAGVTRAWTFPIELGLGTVVVRIVNDNAGVIPDAATVAAVQAALQAQRPITAVVQALAPTQLAVPFTIHLVPDTADTRAAVAAGITDLLARLAQPGDGVSRGRVPLSQIRTAIGVAAGVTDYVLTAPAADVIPGVGQLPTLGAIAWV